MAVGIGKTLGYNLIENFSRPYFAASITEFWKRWHISLTRWLTSYIYIPLGGNRCSRLRCYFNIMITFLVSGLWHGANWTFIIWGTLHGIIQIIEKYFGIQKANRNNNLMTIFRILVTFIIINFAWIFFRMPTFEDAISIIYRIFTNHEITLYYASLGDLLLYIIGISILFAKEFHEEFTPKSLKIVNQHYIKWGICLFLFGAILCEGVLDSGSFIYVSF